VKVNKARLTTRKVLDRSFVNFTLCICPVPKVPITLCNAGSGIETALRSDVALEVLARKIPTSTYLTVLKTSRELFLK